MENILLKIAYRNLKEHKTKSLIIGILIMLGITILVVGNSFIETASQGIEDNYINNYTGNIIITSSEIESPSLTAPSGDIEAATPILPQYPEIKEYVQSLKGVSSVTEQLGGMASIKWGEFGEGFAILYGVEPESYRASFPDGVNIVEGRFLKPGEPGILISREIADSLNETSGEVIKPGDSLLLTSMNGNSGTKIREMTVYGIHEPVNGAAELGYAAYVDPKNMRILNGITLNTVENVSLTSEEETLLGSVNENDLFGEGEDDLFADLSVGDDSSADPDWDSILGDTSQRDYFTATDPNGWHYIMVSLNQGVSSEKMIRDLNGYFAEEGIEARAWDWIDGAGMSAQLANTMKIAFNVLIFIVAIVAVIIIMNTLVISVTERIGEIGTMRAIGAKKSFVRMMITWETIIISIFFGLMGIVLGAAIVAIMGSVGFSAGGNMFLTVLLGGEIFRPVISLSAMGLSLIVITIIGVIASLYPVSVALKISPVQAMSE
jgi:putative ABC transport system permease protein